MGRSRWRAAWALVWAAGCATAGGVADPGEADLLVSSARTAYYRGDYAAAEEKFVQALNLYERYDDRQGAAYVWNNLGSVALRRRDYAAAETHFARARAVFESIDDANGRAIATNNLGTALRYLERMPEALAAHEEAIGLAEAAKNPVVQAAAHSGIGLVLMEKADPDRDAALREAERRLRLALALQEKAQDKLGRATTLGNLGALAALQNDVPQAIRQYSAALDLDRELEHVAGIGQDLLALAELHMRAKDYVRAGQFAERALRVHEEIGDAVGVREAQTLIEEVAHARTAADAPMAVDASL